MGGRRGTAAKNPPACAETAGGADKHRACLHSQLQKTRLCVYHTRGTCQYGTNCSFAHTQSELSKTPDLQRTRLCALFAQGQCDDPNCSFAHGDAELRSTDMFYKKAMCIWHERGRCRNGESCRFAHGPIELREKNGRSNVVATPGEHEQKLVPSAEPSMQAVVAQAQVLAAAFVAGQVSAQKTVAPCPLPPQHWPTQQSRPTPHQHVPRQKQQFEAQQLMMRTQELHAHSQANRMPLAGEPMKVTSRNMWHQPQQQQNEPARGMQFSNLPEELAALGQLAIQMHQASMPASPAPISAPIPIRSPVTSSPASSSPAVAAGGLAALAAIQEANLASQMANAQQHLAALQDANLASQMASAQQHPDSNIQVELAKLCESISTLSVQCSKLQHQVQAQVCVNPGSTGSASTTAESLPGWGSYSEKDEKFSPQVSFNPAKLLDNREMGRLGAQDIAPCPAQWAAALRLATTLQQLS